MIHACKGLHYKERLMLLQLPTLKYRRYRGDMIQVFKILHHLYQDSVVPPLVRNFDSRTRGNALKLKIQRCRYDIRKYSFCNRVINMWNSLPDYVVTSESVNVFKNNLDKYWEHKEFYYDFEADLVGF